MEMISVIIPIYNVDEYLKRCLDSVCAQTYTELEIILVDDGSSDNSPVICDEYAGKDDRITVIHKENGGVSAARNDGLNIAKGRYIIFIDADDYVEHDMLKKMHALLLEKSSDIVSCGYYEHYADRTEVRGIDTDSKVMDKREALADFCTMGGALGSGNWNKLFKREIIADSRFKSYTNGEDVEFLCRAIIRSSSVACAGSAFYHYVHRENSASRRKFNTRQLDMLSACDDMFESIKEACPEVLSNMYAFHLSWVISTVQMMYFARPLDEETEKYARTVVDNSVKKYESGYKNNKYVNSKEYILLQAYKKDLFNIVYTLINVLRKLKKIIKDIR